MEFIADIILERLGIDVASKAGEALHFFIKDTIWLLLLLYLMIAVVGVLRTYIPNHKVKKYLSNSRYGMSYIAASVFGALTPFCSCSSIPIFIGFLKAGSPVGPAFAFLVTSPLLNEYLAVLMLAFFGWKITLAYVVFGLVVGISSGILASKMNLEKEIVENLTQDGQKDICYNGIMERIHFGISEANSIVRDLWKWVILGVGAGAIIHGFIPQKLIEDVIGTLGIFSVPVAVIIGVPLYANCSAVVPIALVLFQKGVPLGTALALMMSTSSLSLPEAVILRRAMKLRAIIFFFTLVAVQIVIAGYLFNILQIILVD